MGQTKNSLVLSTHAYKVVSCAHWATLQQATSDGEENQIRKETTQSNFIEQKQKQKFNLGKFMIHF